MPILSPDELASLRASTANAARAFAEDIDYFQRLIGHLETSRGELRRISGILRRLLVEKDVLSVAAPRIGRMKFIGPNNKPFYDAEKRIKILFFASGGAKIFGVDVKALALFNAGPVPPLMTPDAYAKKQMDALHVSATQTVELRLDNFLAQKVLCYNGQWSSRRAAIKYIAQVASGVHSGPVLTDEDRLLEQLRQSCSYSIKGGKVEIHMMPQLGAHGPAFTVGAELSFSADALDPVLVEMIATASMLVTSPDVLRLRDAIRQESG
jgi:hypothetical protein